MRRRQDDRPGSVEDERRALNEQRRALEDLKRQLAERVAAVQEREGELRRAITQVHAGTLPGDLVALPTHAGTTDVRRVSADAGPRGANPLPAAYDAAAAELERREGELARKEAELARREAELARALPPPPVDPGVRLAELHAAEQAFLRTREELSARAEAVAAREQLVADRERELRASEKALPGEDLHDLEARLRLLESQRAASAQQSFSGGIRKLERGGTRRTQ